jgi:hypothetical protein
LTLRRRAFAFALCGSFAGGIPSTAQAAETPDDCAGVPSDRERLACYDRTHERPARPRGSILDQLWPSVDDEDRERLTLMGHNTNYVLPLRLTNTGALAGDEVVQVYICGLTKMVAEVKELARGKLALPRRHVHVERFD